MNLKNYKPLFFLTAFVGLAYGIHKGIFYSLKINTQTFQYSTEFLYALFLLFTLVIAIVLLTVKVKSFDNVGMSFLLATSIKMMVCYLILRPLLQATGAESSMEKINFFITFIVFLAIETLFTIRLVNEKQ
ncbi:hypothetical protein [Flavobacterium restrictum]|uniref:Uncharacterized protein n=1 Tax=Flavobacterium restrictum TaxID=2594428 RepID=A0A553E5U4_9FLAO|nr:hypothetical protein [Flavobacterium restrictum]TRX40417.1 hypothetical protein FNW21_06720 [Flavobacterium restrictum]